MRAYSVTITRWDDDEGTEVVDQYINADKVIDLMADLKEAEDPTATPESDQEEEEVEEEPEESERQKGSRAWNSGGFGGRKSSYDKEAVKVAIKGGQKPKEIAEEHSIPLGSVYQLKSKMKKDGELGSATVDTSPQTVKDLPELPTEKVHRFLSEGMTEEQVYAKMHDYMTHSEFREAIDSYTS